jgi:hypothetical protein
MKVGQIIGPRRPLSNFSVPAVVREKRMGKWGVEYSVVNGFPRNASVRWYSWRDVRPAPSFIEGAFTPVS